MNTEINASERESVMAILALGDKHHEQRWARVWVECNIGDAAQFEQACLAAKANEKDEIWALAKQHNKVAECRPFLARDRSLSEFKQFLHNDRQFELRQRRFANPIRRGWSDPYGEL